MSRSNETHAPPDPVATFRLPLRTTDQQSPITAFNP
jgi:hypothetical protein